MNVIQKVLQPTLPRFHQYFLRAEQVAYDRCLLLSQFGMALLDTRTGQFIRFCEDGNYLGCQVLSPQAFMVYRASGEIDVIASDTGATLLSLQAPPGAQLQMDTCLVPKHHGGLLIAGPRGVLFRLDRDIRFGYTRWNTGADCFRHLQQDGHYTVARSWEHCTVVSDLRRSAKPLLVLDNKRGGVTDWHFTPGHNFLSFHDSGWLRLADLYSGKIHQEVLAHPKARECPFLWNALLTVDRRTVATAHGMDHRILLWDTATLQVKQILDACVSNVERLQKLPNGRLRSTHFDNHVCEWCPQTGQLLASEQPPERESLDPPWPPGVPDDVGIYCRMSDGTAIGVRQLKLLPLERKRFERRFGREATEGRDDHELLAEIECFPPVVSRHHLS